MAEARNGNVVHIVDDDTQVRDLLAKIVDAMGLRSRVYTSADELLAAPTLESPGVIVMDLRMPGTSGLEAFRRLKQRGCDLPIVFLTGFADVPTVAEAMREGAFDFLEKPARRQQVVETLQAALAEHTAVVQRTARKTAAEGLLARLTARERDVVPYLVGGWISKRVAAQLGVSKKAIDVHRANILRKTEVGSVAELVRVVVDAGADDMLTTPR